MTPMRVLAVSGWAAVAEASELAVRGTTGRDQARRNRITTAVELHKTMRPTPIC
jgi:hypothetical protein